MKMEGPGRREPEIIDLVDVEMPVSSGGGGTHNNDAFSPRLGDSWATDPSGLTTVSTTITEEESDTSTPASARLSPVTTLVEDKFMAESSHSGPPPTRQAPVRQYSGTFHFPGMSFLPGIGKVLATPSQNPCDVDAYMGQAFPADSDTSSDYGSPGGHSMASGDTVDLESSSPVSDKGRRQEIVLDPNSDPFTPRAGKTLTWKNVNMTLTTRKGEPDRKLLHEVWGQVPKTETSAIMGASGAGKTSLLNILSGRATTGGSIKIDADVRLNNYAVDPTNLQVRKLIAFVAQDDSLQATTTPREAIRFSAKLRGPRCTTEAQLDKLATRMIDELGLSSCADSIVGGPLLKGISGGERKRASVGVELVTRPAMVFLDEPTSGLDSFSAVQVCQVLKKVANAGASVLFTIHQPSSEIFTSFDHLILLHKGRVLYQGSTTNVSNYFGARGYPCPNNFNPADWIVNVAQKYSPALLEKQGFFPEDDREMTEPNIPGHGQDALGNTIHRTSSVLAKGNEQQTPGFWTQVKMLSRRELVHMYRFPLVPKARFGLTTGLSFLVGTIFWEVGEASVADPFYLQSRFGAIMILLVFAMIGSAQPAILFFPEERPIFLREYTTDHYSVPAYFLSRLFIELFNTLIQIFIMVTIIWNMVKFQGSYLMYYLVTVALAITATALAVLLGVISRGNAKVAQQLLPLIMLPQLLFSGFFVSPDLIPVWLQWPQYLCVLTYTVRLLMLEEFYECSDEPLEARSCDLVLENVQADPDEAWWYWLLIAAQFVFFRLMALFLLKRGAKHFY